MQRLIPMRVGERIVHVGGLHKHGHVCRSYEAGSSSHAAMQVLRRAGYSQFVRTRTERQLLSMRRRGVPTLFNVPLYNLINPLEPYEKPSTLWKS